MTTFSPHTEYRILVNMPLDCKGKILEYIFDTPKTHAVMPIDGTGIYVYTRTLHEADCLREVLISSYPIPFMQIETVLVDLPL